MFVFEYLYCMYTLIDDKNQPISVQDISSDGYCKKKKKNSIETQHMHELLIK